MKKTKTEAQPVHENPIRARLRERRIGPTDLALLAHCRVARVCSEITTGTLSGRLREVVRDACAWTDEELDAAVQEIERMAEHRAVDLHLAAQNTRAEGGVL